MNRTLDTVRYGQLRLPNRSLSDMIIAATRRVADRVAMWEKRIADRGHLASLDDRLLRDMGLNRLDVTQESQKPFWKD